MWELKLALSDSKFWPLVGIANTVMNLLALLMEGMKFPDQLNSC
jgi:hypothetical protein